MTDQDIDSLAQLLFEYGRLNQTLHAADAIIALCNMDIRQASRAADLYHQGLAPVVVTSGGIGRLTPADWTKPEAVMFAEELYRCEVPTDKVIIEDTSTNLPENIKHSMGALQNAGLPSASMILVTLSFAERRIVALCQKQFPDIDIQITSPSIGYEDYANDIISREELIQLIVGELDRLDKFPAKGFSTYQRIPQEILDATSTLQKNGFDKYKVV